MEHLVDLRLLQGLAVHPRRESRAVEIELVGRDDPRTEPAGAIEVLPRDELRGVPLEVAHCALHQARVSNDDTHRVLLWHGPDGLADHDGELTFVIERRTCGRADHRRAMTDERRGEAGEDRRVGGQWSISLVRLGSVVAVVEPDAENPLRVGNRRHPGQFLDRKVRCADRGPFDIRSLRSAKRVGETRPPPIGADVAQLLSDNRTEDRTVVDDAGRESHESLVVSGWPDGMA
jgi:hypothetical protein